MNQIPISDLKKLHKLSIFQELDFKYFQDLLNIRDFKKFAKGEIIYRPLEPTNQSLFVMEGLFRIFITSPSGKQITIRYAKSSEFIGLITSFQGPMDLGVQAIEKSTAIVISNSILHQTMKLKPEILWKIAEESTKRVYDLITEFHKLAFSNLNQKIASHLLSTAISRTSHPNLVVNLTQQELADAVGTVREVLVRELSKFKVRKIIQTERKRIEILKPKELLAIAEG